MDHSYAFTPQIWLSVLAVIFLLALVVQAWRHRDVAGAIPFAIGCLFATFWAGGSVMEYAAIELGTKIFWFKFQTVFQLPATAAVTCFVLEYAWPGRWLTRRNLILLSIPPLLVLVLTLTNNLNHLMWTGFKFEETLNPSLGIAAKIFIAYAYALGILNIFVFGWLFVRSPQHRWPVAIMALGQITVRVFFVLDLAHVFQSNLPLDIIGLAFTYLMYIIALFGFRLLDPIPLALQIVTTQMPDGMLILDTQNRVSDLNPAAEAILATTRKNARRQSIGTLLPSVADTVLKLLSEGAGQAEITLNSAAGPRFYTLETSAIRDWRAVQLGQLLLLRDVTAQKQAQAQIVEQHRALAMLQERGRVARDLHDNLGQVIAFVNAQGQTVRRLLSQGEIPAADAQISRLIEVAREADVDIRESITGLRLTLPEHGLFPTLEGYLAQYEKNYGIQTKLIKPEGSEAAGLDPQVETQLLSILQEALSNVRKHASARHVEVMFAIVPGWVNVTLSDDGTGFDPNAHPEAPGEHFGLRVMHERAEEMGGVLSVNSVPGQGTQVKMRIPMKER